MSLHSDFGTAELGSGELISDQVGKLSFIYGNQKTVSQKLKQKSKQKLRQELRQVNQELRNKCRQIASDLAKRQETFLRSKLRSFWLTPRGIKFVKNFLVLKKFSRTVEIGPNRLYFVSELSIECKPAFFRKIFLKTEK